MIPRRFTVQVCNVKRQGVVRVRYRTTQLRQGPTNGTEQKISKEAQHATKTEADEKNRQERAGLEVGRATPQPASETSRTVLCAPRRLLTWSSRPASSAGSTAWACARRFDLCMLLPICEAVHTRTGHTSPTRTHRPSQVKHETLRKQGKHKKTKEAIISAITQCS